MVLARDFQEDSVRKGSRFSRYGRCDATVKKARLGAQRSVLWYLQLSNCACVIERMGGNEKATSAAMLMSANPSSRNCNESNGNGISNSNGNGISSNNDNSNSRSTRNLLD